VGDEYDWLPCLIKLTDYSGRWEEYVEALYAAFEKDFIENKPTLNGKQIDFRRDGEDYEGKEWAFWYLTCDHPRGFKEEGDWETNLRRCERINWIIPLIAGYEYGAADIVAWFQTRRGEERFAIGLADFSYVVILRDTGSSWLLITHFYNVREHEKRKYREEYLAHKKTNAAR